MKRLKLFTAICLAVGLLLAGCTQDDVTDGNALPERQYPLEVDSVPVSVGGSERPWGANAPQTRVAETPADGMSSAWEWNGSEKIGVQLYADGETAVYTLNADKSLSKKLCHSTRNRITSSKRCVTPVRWCRATLWKRKPSPKT